MKKNLKKAFTLVEMLIVVIIIGILMAALLPKLKGAQERARDTARKANLSQISTALEMYYNDNGIYPNAKCASDLVGKLTPQYMNAIPRDPQKSRVTYWTLQSGCGTWSYAYTPLYNNGSQSGWAVLIANVEAAGRVWNFILVDGKITFDWSTAGTNKRMGADIGNNVEPTKPDLTKDDIFNSSQYAQKAQCETTEVNPTDAWDNKLGKWCWTDKYTNGVAKTNSNMVYTVFN